MSRWVVVSEEISGRDGIGTNQDHRLHNFTIMAISQMTGKAQNSNPTNGKNKKDGNTKGRPTEVKDREPGLEELRLGSALAGVMLGAGLSQEDISRRLGWSASTASRLINGRRGGHARQVTAWLDACRVTGELRAEILAMRLPCGTCGCRCDHTGLVACCDPSEPLIVTGASLPQEPAQTGQM